MTQYAEYKLVQEARDELKKAFVVNAALRATKVDLEKKLKKLEDKLMANEKVDAILGHPQYKNLAVLKDKSFLIDIESEVASEYKKRQKKSKERGANGVASSRSRLSDQDKQNILVEIVKEYAGKSMKVSDIADGLKKRGISTSASVWLKSLGLPEATLKPVSGSKRDGTHFRPKNVSWLKEYA